MQEGEVTGVKVEGDKLELTGHIWVVSPVEEGGKFESHNIVCYDVGWVWWAIRRKGWSKGERVGSKI